jgi:hypothetical protein
MTPTPSNSPIVFAIWLAVSRCSPTWLARQPAHPAGGGTGTDGGLAGGGEAFEGLAGSEGTEGTDGSAPDGPGALPGVPGCNPAELPSGSAPIAPVHPAIPTSAMVSAHLIEFPLPIGHPLGRPSGTHGVGAQGAPCASRAISSRS